MRDLDTKHPLPPEEFYDYMFHVIGVRVENWQGWLSDDGYREESRENLYWANVYMQIPEEGKRSSATVGLWDITEEQITKLKQLRSSYRTVRWHKVSFSGTLRGIMRDGQVFIDRATITPINE